MTTGKSTRAVTTHRLFAAALAVLLCTGAPITPAAAADSADALPARAALYGYFHEPRDDASVHAQRANFDEIRRRVLTSQYHSIERSAPLRSAPVDAFPSDLPARLHYAFAGAVAPSSDLSRQGESEVLLKNSDAFARAKVRLSLGREWPAFVYADLGAVDSTLRWQGLAGIHGGHGVDLMGGWRHVTYHFSPGKGFDSLDFNGPFLGATLAW